jgi:hypothetical protein
MGFRLSVLTLAGRILNLAGFPGWIRAGSHCSQFGTVQVRVTALYTIVTVNSMDVYFYRLTGGIDGVGVSQTANYTGDGIPAAVGAVDPPPLA